MEPERRRHIGIPASTSNRVAAIADFNQEVARAAGAFRDSAGRLAATLSGAPTPVLGRTRLRRGRLLHHLRRPRCFFALTLGPADQPYRASWLRPTPKKRPCRRAAFQTSGHRRAA
jgi:hypothetical protein